eukprot:gnl/Hemi2/24200_TR8118_c0_g1_i2.p2 gnl/Hemi2/24200_TR8118_c0_g1~~gnl/Hemi2/24200_TR8118_c0_g1_i2.p2  ORF type:complete len:107 (+),score=10.68 gnl/Hemi2/24200_TR8118_c0_g1_i2:506-826(+)
MDPVVRLVSDLERDLEANESLCGYTDFPPTCRLEFTRLVKVLEKRGGWPVLTAHTFRTKPEYLEAACRNGTTFRVTLTGCIVRSRQEKNQDWQVLSRVRRLEDLAV